MSRQSSVPMSAAPDTVAAMSETAATVAVLDPAQQRVCELPAEANAVVVGGPGSGKTTALIERAASLAAQTGWSPDHLLVLTANRLAAAELRDRLALRLGTPSAGPIARSAASVAFSVVQAQRQAPVTLLTGTEHDSLIAELLLGEIADGTDHYWLATLPPEARQLRGFRSELREFLMRVEELGVQPGQLRALAEAHGRAEWGAVARFIEVYTGPKFGAHPGQFDAAELGAFAARILSEASGDAGPLDELRVVLVDDAQEATQSTISLLRALASRGIAVTAFGDPDVASNGFRGGRADLLGDFASLLGVQEPERVILTERRRGGERIRREYARVVAAIGTRGIVGHREVFAAEGSSAPAVSAAASASPERAAPANPLPESAASPNPVPESGAPQFAWARLLSTSPYTEARAIAEELRKRHVLHGVPWAELAVVARSTRTVLDLETTLARLGVPTRRTISRVLLRDDPAARWLLDAAQLAIDWNGFSSLEAADPVVQHWRESLWSLLGGPMGGLDPIELRRLKLAARGNELDIVEAFRLPATWKLLASRLGDRARSAAEGLSAAVTAAETGSIEDVLWQLWSHSAALPTWRQLSMQTGALADEAHACLDAVVALFGAARRFVERRPNESGRVFVSEQLAAEIPEDLISAARAGQTVTIATPSQLVGREFDTVVVANLSSGVWPNLRPRYSLLHADELIAALHSESAANGPTPTNTLTPSSADGSSSAARAEVRSDEYRLFALAISRARSRVVLSAQRGEDAEPSVLFGPADDLPLTPRTPTRLRELAAQLRRELVRSVELAGAESAAASTASSAAAATAASGLARLAAAGVPGAHPDDWYGLRQWSTMRGLYDAEGDTEGRPSSGAAGDAETRAGGDAETGTAGEDTRIRVSPSAIDKLERSSLAWFVDRYAPAPPGDAQGTGLIIHSALERLGDRPTVTVEDFIAEVEPKLASLVFEAEWMRAHAERRVHTMLEKLVKYLHRAAADGRRVLAAEAEFDIARGRVSVHGVIDRIEQTASGSALVVDLKTGATKMTAAEVEGSAQLQCYQLALREGGVDGIDPTEQLEGAALLYVQTTGASYSMPRQSALRADAAEQAWERVIAAAERMNGPVYENAAVVTEYSPLNDRRYRIQVVPAVSHL